MAKKKVTTIEEDIEEEESEEYEEEKEPEKVRFYEKRSYNKKQAREAGRGFYQTRYKECKTLPESCANALAQFDCNSNVNGKKLIADCKSSVRFAVSEKPKKKTSSKKKIGDFDIEKALKKKK